MPEDVCCPDCGTGLVSEPGIGGLCPQCLLSLALRESPQADPDHGSSAPGEALTLDRPSPGRILGERYQIRELLGRGGMGEVFRAFDLKLRVDVALKAVRAEKVGSERAGEQLRQEVRSAREVVSPNVCRIFDLVAEDGQELVSMEFVDGDTLGEVLRQRGPLPLSEAREIASQFLSGLEAIHQSGLVHRDFKPENVMLTRAGRVVVMDFGLAKAHRDAGTGTIAGTPAYMAPEQARGGPVDARADVFAAGVVLAELLSVGGLGSHDARQALWQAVRETPPRVPDGPWASVLRQALSAHPAERHASARELARALEDVTQRLPGFETKSPYPGLSSFTEEDAEYFFGREVEVEAVWKKLKRPRMLALVAPSGAGKSSFLRAGLLPALPKGWKALVATPGNRPFQALARTLVPVFAGDTQATEELLRFEDPDTAISLLQRFRRRHEHALVIVDQFEELFTLNPPEVQEAFARLLGRLVLDGDLHVILSLRDDFLFRCQDHEALVPAFSDLTPLGTLGESGLRRALVQPALSCGYRFEDEALVDEMVAEVRKERGALPLLAFAASRLWEKRDHEKGQLARAAYREIGGVAGALAQHAEATLERIGTQRVPLVRELFRNLVTAQGTRAVREREELLSVFGESGEGERRQAEEVLTALVDARLLTAYERAEEGGESHQQVEIVHESLLQAWPRLVRWQTQDQDGAQLRDQLRQAAQLWQDRGRTDDLLWSGQAYRDLALWRERYPVPLTASEESFAKATEANATRRRRRRKAALAALVGAATMVAIVTSVLWQRADSSRRAAEAAAIRSEASKLLALGQLELDEYPTAALAYATRSLELVDGEVARLFALRALQRGPTATLTPASPESAVTPPAFSPNGEWLAFGGFRGVQVFGPAGGKPFVLGGDYAEKAELRAFFGPSSDRLVTNNLGEIRIWSIPEGRELRREAFERGPSALGMGRDSFVTMTLQAQRWVLRQYPLNQGPARVIGSYEGEGDFDYHPEHGLAYVRGTRIYLRSLVGEASPPRLLAEHAAAITQIGYRADGQRLVARDESGEARIWPMAAGPRPLRVRVGTHPGSLNLDPGGRWLTGSTTEEGRWTPLLWDLAAPPGAEPLALRRAASSSMAPRFEPSGRWAATLNGDDGTLWSIGEALPHVLAPHEGFIMSLAFAPDGKRLFSAASLRMTEGTLRSWPLSPDVDDESLVLARAAVRRVVVDAPSRQLVLTPGDGRLQVVPIGGGRAREIQGLAVGGRDTGHVDTGDWPIAIKDSLVAMAPEDGPPDTLFIRLVDLKAGGVRALPPLDGVVGRGAAGFVGLQFVGHDRLLASVHGKGLILYDLQSGKGSPLLPQVEGPLAVGADGRLGVGSARGLDLAAAQGSELYLFHLDGSRAERLISHGKRVGTVALSPDATLVATGSVDGTVRIGPASAKEPYVFFGHRGGVFAIAFSPDGRWVASGGDDGTIRLWPVPDTSKPAPHTLDRERFLALLHSKTNLLAVPDTQSPTGWKIDRGPFTGWGNPSEP